MIRVAAAAAAITLVLGEPGHAACMEATPKQKSEFADVVFEGVALPGPADHGVLITPARFRVSRYLKGDGPDIRLVATALSHSVGGHGYMAEGILPGAGQQWRIFAGPPYRDEILPTGICSGSGPIPLAAAFVRPDEHGGFRAFATVGVFLGLPVALGLILLRRHRGALRA